MRKFLIPIVLAATAVTAAPAAAQPWRLQPVVQRQIQQDINQLQNQIARAAQRRTVSQREATSLRRQATQVQRNFNAFSRGGLNQREVTTLESQVNQVRARLRLERRDWDGRRG